MEGFRTWFCVVFRAEGVETPHSLNGEASTNSSLKNCNGSHVVVYPVFAVIRRGIVLHCPLLDYRRYG